MFFRSDQDVDDFPKGIVINEKADSQLIGLNTPHGLALREVVGSYAIPPEFSLCLHIGYGRSDLIAALMPEKVEVCSPEYTIFGMYDFFQEGVFKLSMHGFTYYICTISQESSGGGGYCFCNTRESLEFIYKYFSTMQMLNETKYHLEYSYGSWSPLVIPDVNLDDVILPDDIKKDFLEDVERFFTKGPEVSAKLGIPHKRGALFIGPPGGGKSSLLNGLAATGKYQFRTIGSKLGSNQLPEIFNTLKNPPPTIVRFEDLDVLLQGVSLSEFLNLMDGARDIKNTYFVGTTNNPEAIDPALLHRPSRFDRKFVFGLPNQEDINRYFRYFLQKSNANDKEFDDIMTMVENLSKKELSYASLKEIFTVAAYKHYEEDNIVKCFKYGLDLVTKQTNQSLDQIHNKMQGRNSKKRAGFRQYDEDDEY